MKIVVVGAGFGGLAAAIRLRAQGHEVTLIEALDQPGGRARVFRRQGFTFDAGPTIVTAPWLIDQLFALSGKQTSDYIELVPLDPYYNVRFEDGSVFRYSGSEEEIIAQVEALNPADVEGYRRFSRAAAQIFETGFAMIDKPFPRVRDMLRVAPALLRAGAWRSVAALVDGHMKDERLRQVFSFHPLLLGGNPFTTTSIYALIHHLEKKWGVWYAMGGMGALARALADLFVEMGGAVNYNSVAAEITLDKSGVRATGVATEDGRHFAADAVVSDADVFFTYERLVPSRYRRRATSARLSSMSYSMSVFVVYFGTRARYDDMAHHEILMGPRYRDLLREVFDKKTLAGDFSLYLHRPTATDPSVAPPGHDAFYALSPVPNLAGTTRWDEAGQAYQDAILGYLEKRYLPGLGERIVTSHRVDPRYFRDDLRSHLGAAFSFQPTLLQSAWFRPHNHSGEIRNLFLVGAGTHPGAGIPGVLSSGRIAADQIAALST